MPGDIQPGESRQINTLITPAATKTHRGADQQRTNPAPSELIRDDKPAQMRPGLLRVEAIDHNGTVDAPMLAGQPQTIALVLIAAAKLRHFPGHPGLKRQTETGLAAVIERVQFTHAPDTARDITLFNRYAHQAP